MQIILPNIIGLISPQDLFKLDGAKCYFGEADKDSRMYAVDTYLNAEMTIVAPHFLWIKQGLFWHQGNIVHVFTQSHEVSILITDVYGRQLLYLNRIIINQCEIKPSEPPKDVEIKPPDVEIEPDYIKYASEIYPIWVENRLNISASMTGSGFLMLGKYDDDLILSSNMRGNGTLNTVLKQHTVEHEQLAMRANMLGNGIIKSILSNYDADIENLVLSYSLTGNGQLNAVRIEYDYGRENLNLSYSLTGNGVLQ